MMKVILLKDVKGVGQRGKIVEVKDGYAYNFLIPHKAAEQATPENVTDARRPTTVTGAGGGASARQKTSSGIIGGRSPG